MVIDWKKRLRQKGINGDPAEVLSKMKTEKSFAEIAEFFGVSFGNIQDAFRSLGISPGRGIRSRKKTCAYRLEKIGKTVVSKMTLKELDEILPFSKWTIKCAADKLGFGYKKKRGRYKVKNDTLEDHQ